LCNLLLDSDIIIDHLRKYSPAKDYLQKVFSGEKGFAVSVITEAEVLSGKGLDDNNRKSLVIQLLDHFTKITVSSEIAQLAGEFKRKYEMRLMDAMIAATAIRHDLRLITRNIRHYRCVPNLQVEKPYE